MIAFSNRWEAHHGKNQSHVAKKINKVTFIVQLLSDVWWIAWRNWKCQLWENNFYCYDYKKEKMKYFIYLIYKIKAAGWISTASINEIK